MDKFLKIVGKGKRGARDLTLEEAREAARMIVRGEATPAQIGAFLVAERIKTESVEEIVAFAEVLREASIRLIGGERAAERADEGALAGTDDGSDASATGGSTARTDGRSGVSVAGELVARTVGGSDVSVAGGLAARMVGGSDVSVAGGLAARTVGGSDVSVAGELVARTVGGFDVSAAGGSGTETIERPLTVLRIDCAGPYNGRQRTFFATWPAAFVLAEAGMAVTLHGVREIGPKRGITLHMMLETRGVDPDRIPLDRLVRALREIGVGYAPAGKMCPPLAALHDIRNQLGLRTVLNTAEKLLDYGGSPNLVMGVFHRTVAERYGEVAIRLGYERTAVVQGMEGSEDLFVDRPTSVWLAERDATAQRDTVAEQGDVAADQGDAAADQEEQETIAAGGKRDSVDRREARAETSVVHQEKQEAVAYQKKEKEPAARQAVQDAVVLRTDDPQTGRNLVFRQVIDPEQFGLRREVPEMEWTAARQMEMAEAVLKGSAPAAFIDMTVLNAAFRMHLAGRVDTLEKGIELSRTLIASGRPHKRYQDWILFLRQAE